MKRIVSLLVVISILLSFQTFTAFAEDSNDYGEAESFAEGIGLISGEDYDEDKILTRAEFAVLLSKLCGLDDENADDKEWQENNYSESSKETVNMDSTKGRFSDVDVSHPNYSQIMAVCQAGYMNGVSDGKFAPEYNLVMEDAVKVFVDMLGYSQMSKINSSVAQSIGLTKGITVGQNKPATLGAVVKLIYNALDINVLEMKMNSSEVSYVNSDETFMSAVLGMEKVSGVMTDNGFTTFKGMSAIGENEVKVGGIVAQIADDEEYVRELIGHKVDMYYNTTGDSYEVVYAKAAKNDDSITFDISQFDSFKNNTIAFDNGSKIKSEKLAKTVYMIYNGEAKTTFDESVFDFEFGNVTLINPNGKGYEVIAVNCYEFAVVGSKNTSEELIYNKLKSSSKADLNIINCQEGKVFERVTIKDTAQNTLSLEDLAENDVLNILRNSRQIKIIASKIYVDGFNVKSISSDEENGKTISDGEKTYAISESYEGYSEKVQFMSGSTYTIYLNMFDKVVWASKYAGGESIGILTKVYYNAFDEERWVKIFTAGGKIEKIKVNEKIKLNDKNRKYEEIYTSLEELYGKAVMYTQNTDGTLTKIVAPESFGTFGNRGWHEVAPEGSYTYHANDNDLSQMMFYVKGTTNLFTVPKNEEDFGDEKMFSVNTATFSDNGSVTAVGYARDKYSVIPDVIVLKSDKAGAGAVSTYSNAFVIERKSQGINADDEPVDILEGYLINISSNNISEKSLIINSECVMVDQKNGYEISEENAVELTGPKKVADLEKGDIIRFTENSSGEVVKIRIAYDCSTGSYFNTGNGGYGSDYDLYKTGGALAESGASKSSTGGSTWAGYAMTKSGYGVRVTKNIDIKPNDVDMSDADSVKNSLYVFKINKPNAILVVEKGDNNKLSFRKGTVDDLITYYEAGTVDKTDILVMITEWTSNTRGTVIYKNFGTIK